MPFSRTLPLNSIQPALEMKRGETMVSAMIAYLCCKYPKFEESFSNKLNGALGTKYSWKYDELGRSGAAPKDGYIDIVFKAQDGGKTAAVALDVKLWAAFSEGHPFHYAAALEGTQCDERYLLILAPVLRAKEIADTLKRGEELKAQSDFRGFQSSASLYLNSLLDWLESSRNLDPKNLDWVYELTLLHELITKCLMGTEASFGALPSILNDTDLDLGDATDFLSDLALHFHSSQYEISHRAGHHIGISIPSHNGRGPKDPHVHIGFLKLQNAKKSEAAVQMYILVQNVKFSPSLAEWELISEDSPQWAQISSPWLKTPGSELYLLNKSEAGNLSSHEDWSAQLAQLKSQVGLKESSTLR